MKLVAALGVLLVCVGFSRGQTDYGIGCIHRLHVTQDVTLESRSQHHGTAWLMVGKHPRYPNKRSLLQFENLNTRVCGWSKIIWAKMYVEYVYAFMPKGYTTQGSPFRSRPIEVYQVNKQWNEAQATSTRRTTENNWNQTYLSLSGSNPDAGPGAIDTVKVYTARPRGFIEFDVTSAVRIWAGCSENNERQME